MSAPNADTYQDVSLVTSLLTAKNPAEEAGNVIATQSMGISVTIYRWPDNTTDRQKKAVLTCLTLCGRCIDDRQTAWQTLVLSWSVLCFPELGGIIAALRARDYVLLDLPKDFIDACLAAIVSFMGDTTPTDSITVQFPHPLPQAGLLPVSSELAECAFMEGLYAYYSLIVFLMGKNITDQNRIAITDKRPNALIRRIKTEKARYILTGDGRMGDECHTLINGGWIRSTGPRMSIVKHFAQLMPVRSQQMSTEILGVMFSMMEYSGAQAVYYINQLLIAHPWVSRLPIFRASFHSYSESVRALHHQPHWYKPYYKLAMHDSTKLFRRRDLDPLIAASIVWARQTNPTLARFTIAANMQAPIDAFVRAARERGVEITVPDNQEVITTTQ